MTAELRAVVVEFRHSGFGHAGFNAAFLAALRVALPNAHLTYMAVPSQMLFVKEILGPDLPGQLDLVPFPIAAGEESPTGTLKECYRLARLGMFPEVRRADVVLFSTTHNVELVLIKLALWLFGIQKPVWVIFHGTLRRLLDQESQNPRKWFYSVRKALSLPHPSGLRYLVLGAGIQSALVRSRFMPAWQVASIDLPHHRIHALRPSEPGMPTFFGLLGVGRVDKGIDAFIGLAEKWGGVARFALLGSVRSRAELRKLEQRRAPLEGLTMEAMSHEAYTSKVKEITYVVSPSSPAHYKLAASATFIDALAFCKPGIYLRNDYLEYYFEQLGDVGYLCDDLAQMEEIVASICRSFPAERYRAQCQIIVDGRGRFSAEQVGPHLRKLILDFLP